MQGFSTATPNALNYINSITQPKFATKIENGSYVFKDGTTGNKSSFTKYTPAFENKTQEIVKKTTPTLNFGAGVSQAGVTNVNQYNPETKTTESIFKQEQKPQEKPGIFDKISSAIVPTANAGVNDGLTDDELQTLISEGYSDEEIMKLNDDLLNEAPKEEQPGLLDKFSQGTVNLFSGMGAQAPKIVGEVGAFFIGKPVDYALKKVGLDVPSLEAQFKKDGLQGREDLQKLLGVEPEAFMTKVGEFGAEIGSLATPTGEAKLIAKIGEKAPQIARGLQKLAENAPGTYKLIKNGLVGAKEMGKFGIVNKGDITKEDLTIGAGLGVALPIVGAGLKKTGEYVSKTLPANLQLKGLLNPAKLSQVTNTLIQEGQKTPENVGKWMLDRGIKGDKETIIKQLTDRASQSKQAVDDTLKSIDTQLGKTFKNKNIDKALFQVSNDLQGVAGMENKLADVEKLLMKGEYTLSDANQAKRILDEQYNLYTKAGGESSGIKAEGLRNVRQDIRQFIETEAEKVGAGNIKLLNNETAVARGLSDAIAKKESADYVRELLSPFAGGTIGGIFGGQVGPFKGDDMLSRTGNVIVGALIGKGLTSTTLKTNVASMLNKLSKKEVGALDTYIKSGGKTGLDKELQTKFNTQIENIISNQSKNVPGNNINIPSSSTDINSTTIKPLFTNQPTNVSNKPIKKPSKTGRKILNSILPSNFKEKAQDLVDKVAEKTGAKMNLMPSGNNKINYKEIEKYYKNKLGTDDVTEIMKKVKASSIENQNNIMKKINSGDNKIIDTKTKTYGMEHRPTKTGATGDDITKNGVIPKDIYTNPEYYFNPKDKTYSESLSVLKKIKGNPEAEITIYRAGSKDQFNEGDWITLSKTYAQEHMDRQGSKGVYSMKVKAKDVQFAGDDINEFGYFPQPSKTNLLPTNSKQVSKVSDDLISEAKGYKTFEDFKKGFNRIEHGTNKEFDNFDLKKIGSGQGQKELGFGINFTDKGASEYGNIIKEANIKKEKVFNLEDIFKIYNNDKKAIKVLDDLQKETKKYGINIKDDINNFDDLENYNDFRSYIDNNDLWNELSKVLKENGYIGHSQKTSFGTDYLIYDPKDIINDSKLKQIYEQANKPKLINTK